MYEHLIPPPIPPFLILWMQKPLDGITVTSLDFHLQVDLKVPSYRIFPQLLVFLRRGNIVTDEVQLRCDYC